MISDTCCNCPGLSTNSIVMEQERPDFCKPRPITRERIFTSIFPPEIKHITFFPLMGTLLNMAAATATAPAPSAINLCCSINARIAVEISSSVTDTISSTYCWQRSKVCIPGSFTAIPSAMVRTPSRRSIFPCSIEFNMLGAPLACTP